MSLARSPSGAELLAFLPGPTPELPVAVQHIPITWAVVVPRYQEQLVLMLNNGRQQWEVPGGGREPGETLLACAQRELFEESGQVADALVFRGFCQIRRDDQLEWGGIYTAELDVLRPFTPTLESGGIALWDGSTEWTPPISRFTRQFVAFCAALPS